MKKDLTALQTAPVLENFSTNEIKLFAKQLSSTTYDAGTIIFAEDDLDDTLYILKEGYVNIFISAPLPKKETITITTLQPGDIIGEFSFVDGHRRSAAARAHSDCEVWMMTKPDFEALCQNNPEVALRFMHNIASILSSRVREITMLWRNSQ